jgi:putative transcriptional regulator
VRTELGSCLLAASPSLRCPFFNHTVVLLVDHQDEGSLGFVINKPSEVSFGDLLTQIGLGTNGVDLGRPVMLGGPVSPNTGWVVYDSTRGAALGDAAVELPSGFGVSANLGLLEQIAQGFGPDNYLMMLGYAGWGPGQLDDEIREGAWIPVDLDRRLLFDVDVGDRWATALGTLGIDPARMAGAFVADA